MEEIVEFAEKMKRWEPIRMDPCQVPTCQMFGNERGEAIARLGVMIDRVNAEAERIGGRVRCLTRPGVWSNGQGWTAYTDITIQRLDGTFYTREDLIAATDGP